MALLLCCGLAGACVGDAAAQEPRVDPTLLGTPESPDSAGTRPVEPGAAEIQLAESGTLPAERTAATERQPAPVLPPAGTSPARLRVHPALLGVPAPGPASRLAEDSSSGTPAPIASVTAPPAPVAEAGEQREAAFEQQARREALPDDGAPDRGPPPALRSAGRLTPPDGKAPKNSEPRPVFLSALRMTGEVDREFVAEGEAVLRKPGSVVRADLMTYWPLEDEVEATGGVRLEQGGDVVTGPKMRLRLEDRVGHFVQPSYRFQHQSLMGRKRAEDREESERRMRVGGAVGDSFWNSGFAVPREMKFIPGQTSYEQKIELSRTTESRGEAERIDFEGENHYRLRNNTFTSCPTDRDDWYVRTSELALDYDREVGEGDDATVYFKEVPILYSPWISFSLNNRRKSGFLRPSIGTNSDNGIEYEQPYYWNIAPNMDATISPRVMSKRGIQFGGEFRYLNVIDGAPYDGRLKLEYLPRDRQRDGDNRHALSLVHNQSVATARGFTSYVNYAKVSDNDYYTDLSSDITDSSQTQLLQQGMLGYGASWWSASLNFQQYQTLQPDRNNPVLEQYRMLPQITLNARKPDFHGADLNFLGQYTRFTIREREQFGSTFPDGRRTILYPQIAFPYVKPGWYLTPRFGMNYRNYSLSGQALGAPGSISLTLPVFSLDSGMAFERSSRWFGRDYTQTLEPRLYYVNIPYRKQSDIPLFDTGLADFNFAQIFSENQFSGWDRINNANQLTAALMSRLIDPENGHEIMRAMVGQRYYFARNKVALTGTAISDDKWEHSDFLASFNGQILPKVYVDTAWQYAVADSRTQRFSAGVRYHPEPGRVLNLAYRYNRQTASPVNQVDVSAQWPLFGRWHGVGRLNYSFKDDGTVLSTGGLGGRMIESIAGLEYDGGCWILRAVFRRQALTSVDASTSFFVQLELAGLGRIGSNPLSLLKRNVQGYGLIGDRDSESVFGY
ncbi:MAG: LPS assembly protein LptD [Candidatus Accumulibacter sp.]|jgi:LPS-assembly protein|nr:LPS assembly protein LptD [Accumulibacter sp.]